jgi:hypothetical protein
MTHRNTKGTQMPTFQQYIDAANLNTSDVMDALIFISTAHPIFRNNDTLQDFINGKYKEITGADLSAITKTALSHAISISKKALTLAAAQQMAIAAEINVINAAIAYLNCIRLQIVQETVTSLSEIDAIRRYSQGEVE